MSIREHDDLTARLLRHRTAELEEYKRAALSRDMSPEFVAEFVALKQQLAGAVEALREAKDYLIGAVHDGPIRYEQALDIIDAALAAAGGQ